MRLLHKHISNKNTFRELSGSAGRTVLSSHPQMPRVALLLGVAQPWHKDPHLYLFNRKIFQKHCGSKTSKRSSQNDVILKIPC